MQNAAQAAQVLQECNAILGLPSNLQQSLDCEQSPPACIIPFNSHAQDRPRAAPLKSNSKIVHKPEPVLKRQPSELPDDDLKQLPLKRKKCTLLPASTEQPANHQHQALPDPQTDQAHNLGVSNKQHPGQMDSASSHSRPSEQACVLRSKRTELDELSTEELQKQLCRLNRLGQLCASSVSDGSKELVTRYQQLQIELHSRLAGWHTQGTCTDCHKRLPRPNSQTTTSISAQLASSGNIQRKLDRSMAQKTDMAMSKPQSEAQPVSSPLTALNVQSELLFGEVQVEACQGAARCPNPVHAGSSALLPPAAMTHAQQSVMAGLICQFAATKGPSWLFS